MVEELISNHGLDSIELTDNEDFIAAVYEATDAAMRTRDERMRESLRDAVLNLASGVSLDDVLRGTFFGYLARFSPVHIDALRRLHSLRRIEMFSSSADELLRREMDSVPQGTMDRVIADLIREELVNRPLGQTLTGCPFREAYDRRRRGVSEIHST